MAGGLLLSGFAVGASASTACEPYCNNPCTELSGNPWLECAACNAPTQCRPGEPGFKNDEVNPALLEADAAAARPAGSTTAASLAAGEFLESCAAAFDFITDSGAIDIKGWMRCIPAESDVPHAHDFHNTNFDKQRFDQRCLVAHHMAYYGTDAFLPRREMRGLVSLPPAPGCARSHGHLRPFGAQQQRQRRVQEIEGCLDSRTFLSDYVRARRPAVMRGCAHAHPASVRWATDAYLRALAGDWEDKNFGSFTTWLESYNSTND